MRVGGAKNAVLPLLAASIMCREKIRLCDVPYILDVENMLEILRRLGVKSERDGACVEIDAANADCFSMPEHLSKQLRSSIFMMGNRYSRLLWQGYGHVSGRVRMGLRPIDLHLKGLQALGARIREEQGMIYCDGADMRCGDIRF